MNFPMSCHSETIGFSCEFIMGGGSRLGPLENSV